MDIDKEHPDEIVKEPKSLTEDEKQRLVSQSSRLVPEYQAKQLETNAKKHWDLFYSKTFVNLSMSSPSVSNLIMFRREE